MNELLENLKAIESLRQEPIFSRAVDRIEQLEAENAALKNAINHQMSYERELRADRDRLDWLVNLDQQERLNFVRNWYRLDPKKVRREIDAAMKEGKQ